MLIVIAVVVAMVLVASSGDTKNACGEVGSVAVSLSRPPSP